MYFGSVCEMRGRRRRGAERRRRVAIVKPPLVRGPVADATRDLFVRPRGLRRNVRGAGLASAALVRARLITNVKCYRTQPSAAPSALRCAALHNNKT